MASYQLTLNQLITSYKLSGGKMEGNWEVPITATYSDRVTSYFLIKKELTVTLCWGVSSSSRSGSDSELPIRKVPP
jgi:hypothetical protein